MANGENVIRDLQSLAARQLAPKQIADYAEFQERILSSNLLPEDIEIALRGYICVFRYGL